MDETGSGDQTQQPKMQPQVQTVSVKKISWSKILITVLVIIVVTSIIAVAYWFFVLNKPSDTSDLTGPVPNAGSNIENWKEYSSGSRNFSLKYPPDFKLFEEESQYNLNVQIRSSNFKRQSDVLDGGFSILVDVLDSGDFETVVEWYDANMQTTDRNTKSILLDDVDSLYYEYTDKIHNEGRVAVVTIEGEFRYNITLSFSDENREEGITTFDLMLSTFKFLD